MDGLAYKENLRNSIEAIHSCYVDSIQALDFNYNMPFKHHNRALKILYFLSMCPIFVVFENLRERKPNPLIFSGVTGRLVLSGSSMIVLSYLGCLSS